MGSGESLIKFEMANDNLGFMVIVRPCCHDLSTALSH